MIRYTSCLLTECEKSRRNRARKRRRSTLKIEQHSVKKLKRNPCKFKRVEGPREGTENFSGFVFEREQNTPEQVIERIEA